MEDQGRDGRVIFPVRLSLYSVASLVSSFFFFWAIVALIIPISHLLLCSLACLFGSFMV